MKEFLKKNNHETNLIDVNKSVWDQRAFYIPTYSHMYILLIRFYVGRKIDR